MSQKNCSIKNKNYISSLRLEKHIEGGYFKRAYTSKLEVEQKSKTRKACSAIYYYLEKNEFSAWHRLSADELWHFYDGDSPVLIHCINPKGGYQAKRLGRSEMQAEFMVAIPASYWFAAELEDKTSFALMGCTVAPGFEYEDFELANTDRLIKTFPELKNIIEKLNTK